MGVYVNLTGAQILWECLVREGVDTVFGYPGGAILPAYDALLQFPIYFAPLVMGPLARLILRREAVEAA